MRPDSGDMPRSRPAYAFGQPVAGIAPARREIPTTPQASTACKTVGRMGVEATRRLTVVLGTEASEVLRAAASSRNREVDLAEPRWRHLATAGYDGQVLLWGPTTGRPRHVLEGDGSAMWSVAVSRDGTSLVAVTMDGAAHLWDIGTAVEVCRLRVDGHLSACSFHPYGHRVVLGGSAGLYACEISPMRWTTGEHGPRS